MANAEKAVCCESVSPAQLVLALLRIQRILLVDNITEMKEKRHRRRGGISSINIRIPDLRSHCLSYPRTGSLVLEIACTSDGVKGHLCILLDGACFGSVQIFQL